MIPEKQKILIVDDSEMNRAILTGILDDGYDFLEAENGLQALDVLRAHRDISLVLLDIVMPELDGFGVLSVMGEQHWIDQTPVIMISAESDSMLVERAYQLGATDYISRPFDKSVVRRRVMNTLMLYGKQKHLMRMITEQVYRREKSNRLMTGILSHIVEFRNAESGPHEMCIRDRWKRAYPARRILPSCRSGRYLSLIHIFPPSMTAISSWLISSLPHCQVMNSRKRQPQRKIFVAAVLIGGLKQKNPRLYQGNKNFSIA